MSSNSHAKVAPNTWLTGALRHLHVYWGRATFGRVAGRPLTTTLIDCGVMVLKAWHRSKIPTACILHDSILCCAVETGCAPLVQTLLKGPNLVPPRRNAPSQTAVLHDQDQVLAALLDFGAGPSLVNGSGDSPLHLAVMSADLPMSSC